MYSWPRSGCEYASEMDLVQFALAKPLCCVGLVWVVDNHLNNAGREMKAAPQAACPASWRLSSSEQCGALLAGILGESFKFND